MSNARLIAPAAAPVVEIVRAIRPDQLTAPTPCTEYDVRALVNHLLLWQPAMEGAGRKESVVPRPQETDLTGGDWATSLVDQLTRTAAAWSDPAAWVGMTYMAGPSELPAEMVGGMALCELLVHGGDLASATGQDVRWPADVVAATYQVVAGMAEQGREAGVFGPAVPMPDDAPEFDRMLALTGRDPNWTA